jgi:hypothetical protein
MQLLLGPAKPVHAAHCTSTSPSARTPSRTLHLDKRTHGQMPPTAPVHLGLRAGLGIIQHRGDDSTNDSLPAVRCGCGAAAAARFTSICTYTRLITRLSACVQLWLQRAVCACVATCTQVTAGHAANEQHRALHTQHVAAWARDRGKARIELAHHGKALHAALFHLAAAYTTGLPSDFAHPAAQSGQQGHQTYARRGARPDTDALPCYEMLCVCLPLLQRSSGSCGKSCCAICAHGRCPKSAH